MLILKLVIAFTCGETFNLPQLVAHCLDFTLSNGGYDLFKANQWLEEKYGVEKKEVYKENLHIMRIDDEEEEEYEEQKYKRYETSRLKLAPFHSGKETHEYFFKRGFTRNTAKKFMVGWDMMKLRVTFPIFWRDGTLFGIIGRAILNPKLENGEDNPEFYKLYKKEPVKYYIYDNAPIGQILYPLNYFRALNGDTAVLVEGQLDAIRQHQNCHPEVLSSITSKLSWNKRTKECKQAELLKKLGVKNVVLMKDNDRAGELGNNSDFKILRHDFAVYGVTYPEGLNDPEQLTSEQYIEMLRHKYPYILKGREIRRIE
jgi:DNA primase